MTSTRSLVLLIAAAALVALENYVYFSGGPSVGPGAADEAHDETSLVADAAGEDDLPAVSAMRVAAWLALQPEAPRSPFLTRVEAESLGPVASSTQLRLDGVLWGPTRRVAWIDGRPHSEDDWVGEHRVERIGPGSVWLRRGEEVLELTVPGTRELVEEGSFESVD